MKLTEEKENFKSRLLELGGVESLKVWRDYWKRNGKYKDFEVYLSWKAIRAVYRNEGLRELCEKYDCNDNHITTLGKRVLKELGIL